MGYWDMLREKKPEPLIAPGARTSTDWTTAGKRVFEEMDLPAFGAPIRRSSRSRGRPKNMRAEGAGHNQMAARSACAGCRRRRAWHSACRTAASSHARHAGRDVLNGAPFNVELDGVIGELALAAPQSSFRVTRRRSAPGGNARCLDWEIFTKT